MPEREVLFLLDAHGAVLWSDVGTPGSLPDSRERWDAIWLRRVRLEEIAHSHPDGPAAFSREDQTTMGALDGALGRALRFSVVAPTVTIARVGAHIIEVSPEPWWADLLRLASGMTQE